MPRTGALRVLEISAVRMFKDSDGIEQLDTIQFDPKPMQLFEMLNIF